MSDHTHESFRVAPNLRWPGHVKHWCKCGYWMGETWNPPLYKMLDGAR